MLNTMTRDSYKVSSYSLVNSDAALGLEVYYSKDGISAMAFKGKAVKPAFHYRFRSTERRDDYVNDFVRDVVASAEAKRARKAEAASKPIELTVGDVLVSSWGYDQTNVDYYQVVAMVGKASVSLRPICKHSEETASMVGVCTPIPNKFCGDSFTRRIINGRSVKIEGNYCFAHKKEYTEAGGIRLYKPDNWTSYA